MSRDKGNRAPYWVADYLRPWWPSIEKRPNGQRGADFLGTPGVSIELKTGKVFRNAWLDQARGYPGLPVIIWLPPGMGAKNVGEALAKSLDLPGRGRPTLQLKYLMPVLVDLGYAPAPAARPPEQDPR